MSQVVRRTYCSLVALCALCAFLLAAATAAPALASAKRGTITGSVVGVNGGTFTIQSRGRRMGVVNALTAAANAVARGDYPYVWGGGHAAAGVASTGSAGPGHNGRRVGFDCSGSVAAVLSGAGLWPAGGWVPNDAGVIAYLHAERLIARGPGTAPVEVTLYEDPGVHIFMNIDGRFFGTSDGAGGGNPHGGAGWLYDGAWDATNRAFHKWHFLPSVLRDRTTYGHDFTFTGAAVQSLASELALGDRIRVGYAQNSAGGMSAATLSWIGQLTATGTVIALSPDGSTVTVLTPNGQTLNLSLGGFSWLAQSLALGDGVNITYTRKAGLLTLRQAVVITPATTAQQSGTVTQIAADGSSFTIEAATGQSFVYTTGGLPGILSGVAPGDTVLVTYVQPPSGGPIAQQIDNQGSGAQSGTSTVPTSGTSTGTSTGSTGTS